MRGWLKADPKWKTVRDMPGVATLDGDKGLGLDVGPHAMDLAMDKADTCGVGAVAVTNCWHFGAAGYYAKQALERDMVGVAMTSSGLYVTPTFGAKPLLGTNPIAPGLITGRWLREGIGEAYDETIQNAKNSVLLNRVCEPEDVAAAIMAVIEGPDLMTGQVIPVEGGWLNSNFNPR